MDETTPVEDTTSAPKRGWLSRAWNWIKSKVKSLVSRLRSVRDFVLSETASRFRQIARWGLRFAGFVVPSFITKLVREKGIPLFAKGYFAVRNGFVSLASKIGLGGVARAGWSLTDRLVIWLAGNSHDWKAAPFLAVPGAAIGSFLFWLSGMAWKASGLIGLATIVLETGWRWIKNKPEAEAEASDDEAEDKATEEAVNAAQAKAKARKSRKAKAAPEGEQTETPKDGETPTTEEPAAEAEPEEEDADPAKHFTEQGLANLLESWRSSLAGLTKLLETPEIKVEDILAAARAGSEKFRVLVVISNEEILQQCKLNPKWEESRAKVARIVDQVQGEFKPSAVAEACKIGVPNIIDAATASMIVRNKAYEKAVVKRNIQHASECVLTLAVMLHEVGSEEEAAPEPNAEAAA